MAHSAFSRPRQLMEKRGPTLNSYNPPSPLLSVRMQWESLSHPFVLVLVFFLSPSSSLLYLLCIVIILYVNMYKKKKRSKNKKHLSVVHGGSPRLPTLGPL